MIRGKMSSLADKFKAKAEAETVIPPKEETPKKVVKKKVEKPKLKGKLKGKKKR